MKIKAFRITAPTAISFSGGRTSGFMLHMILEENGGLPDCARVFFANTGKEEEETLEFVREVQDRWNVPIIWVQYLPDDPGYEVVDFASAARAGEPFAALIKKRNYLPNAITRFCTSELKIRTMHKYIRTLGWEDWDQMIGIRADEMRRVTKIRARGRSSESSHETMVMPLADAGVTLSDVNAFWERAPFNLKLTTYLGRTMAGNCDLCFLKPGKQVLSLIRERPARADWWAAQEAAVQSTGTFTGDGARFRNDRPSYAQMKKFSLQQDDLFADDEEGIPCFCGE